MLCHALNEATMVGAIEGVEHLPDWWHWHSVVNEQFGSVFGDSGLEIYRFTIVLLKQEVVALPHYPINELSLLATLH